MYACCVSDSMTVQNEASMPVEVNTSTTTAPPEVVNPNFAAYLTAAIVVLILVIIMFIFCLGLEWRRRRRKRRQLQHVTLVERHSVENYYDKSPVLPADGVSVSGRSLSGISNFGYLADTQIQNEQSQNEQSQNEQSAQIWNIQDQSIQAPAHQDYDSSGRPGTAEAPDRHTNRMVSYISLPDDRNNFVPQLQATVPELPARNPPQRSTPVMSSNTSLVDMNLVSGSHSVYPIIHSSNEPAVVTLDISESDQPNYTTIPGESSSISDTDIPDYATVPEDNSGENSNPNYASIPEVMTSQVDPVSSAQGLNTSGALGFTAEGAYDGTKTSVTSDHSAGLAPAAATDEVDEEVFVTIDNVIHEYEKIPGRTDIDSTVKTSIAAVSEDVADIQDDTCDPEMEDNYQELHDYETLPGEPELSSGSISDDDFEDDFSSTDEEQHISADPTEDYETFENVENKITEMLKRDHSGPHKSASTECLIPARAGFPAMDETVDKSTVPGYMNMHKNLQRLSKASFSFNDLSLLLPSTPNASLNRVDNNERQDIYLPMVGKPDSTSTHSGGQLELKDPYSSDHPESEDLYTIAANCKLSHSEETSEEYTGQTEDQEYKDEDLPDYEAEVYGDPDEFRLPLPRTEVRQAKPLQKVRDTYTLPDINNPSTAVVRDAKAANRQSVPGYYNKQEVVGEKNMLSKADNIMYGFEQDPEDTDVYVTKDEGTDSHDVYITKDGNDYSTRGEEEAEDNDGYESYEQLQEELYEVINAGLNCGASTTPCAKPSYNDKLLSLANSEGQTIPVSYNSESMAQSLKVPSGLSNTGVHWGSQQDLSTPPRVYSGASHMQTSFSPYKDGQAQVSKVNRNFTNIKDEQSDIYDLYGPQNLQFVLSESDV